MIFLSMVLFVCFIVLVVWRIILKGWKKENSYDTNLKMVTSLSALGAFLLTIATFFAAIIFMIPAGHIGVQSLFGKVRSDIYHEGLHIKNPFVLITKMTVQTQSYTMSVVPDEGEKDDRPDSIDALAKDNLKMAMDITVLYSLVPDAGPPVYRNIGTKRDYTEKIVRPGIRTSIRNSTARFLATELMSEMRTKVEQDIEDELNKFIVTYCETKSVPTAILVERVLLRNVKPPDDVATAIERVVIEEKNADAMEFTLRIEQREAERKEIEAKGIKTAQDIISLKLTQAYLQWKYIEAMKALADSENTTFIFAPFDTKLIPMLNVK